jgi:hypothetical protein
MKLGRKDYTIAVKTGTDANKAKFKKECVQGEIYHATDTGFFYIAEVTAGASDATLSKFGAPAFPNQYSVDFDGTDDYISTGLDVGGASALTVSAWVKHDTVGNAAIVTQYVGPNNRAFRLAMYPNTSSWAGLRLDAYNSSNTNFGANYLLNPVISSGVWYHAAFVFTGSDITVYYNGNASPTVSMTGVLDSVTRNVDIGSSGGTSDFLNGKIDEVGIWTSALSASDIIAIYNSGTPTDISSLNPVGYWRMGDNDGGTGTTITDQGSGGNDGTLTNGPTFSTDVP